jgi:hypothetical protein
MPTSIFDTEFQNVLKSAKKSAHQADGPFPSPADWRDKWIYFLMVDRFNNKDAPPLHQPFDDPRFDGFQGGKYSGIKDTLPYLKKLGVGAIWLSPVLKTFNLVRYTMVTESTISFTRNRDLQTTRRRLTMNCETSLTPRMPKISTSFSTSF